MTSSMNRREFIVTSAAALACPAIGAESPPSSRSKFSEPVPGTWFDSVNGAQDLGADVFKNSGELKFSHEMKNAGGDSDWVLVLETEKEKL